MIRVILVTAADYFGRGFHHSRYLVTDGRKLVSVPGMFGPDTAAEYARLIFGLGGEGGAA